MKTRSFCITKKPIGSPLLVPLYLTAAVISLPFVALYYGYKGFEKVKDVIKDSHSSVLKEEQEKQRIALSQRIENPELEEERETEALAELLEEEQESQAQQKKRKMIKREN